MLVSSHSPDVFPSCCQWTNARPRAHGRQREKADWVHGRELLPGWKYAAGTAARVLIVAMSKDRLSTMRHGVWRHGAWRRGACQNPRPVGASYLCEGHGAEEGA